MILPSFHLFVSPSSDKTLVNICSFVASLAALSFDSVHQELCSASEYSRFIAGWLSFVEGFANDAALEKLVHFVVT
jgi:hypothetical protein